MLFIWKIYIFELYNASFQTFGAVRLKTFKEPYIGIGCRKSGKRASDFSVGLFICLCFQTAASNLFYSDPDKGACNRYTLIFLVIGSCKSWFSRGVDSNSLFVGAFSLFFFTCFCFCFGFVHFFFSLLCVNQ